MELMGCGKVSALAIPISSTITPIGYGVAAPVQLGRPPALLADNIDPQTKDFTSISFGMDVIEAQVLVALGIRRGSGAAVMGDGNLLHRIKKMSDASKTEIESMVRAALSRLIDNKDIDYRGCDFSIWSPETQTGEVIVNWVNLRWIGNDQRRTSIFM